ncbi:hypothetical protein FXW78_36235 [Rhodococcus opacus]|nr:hypothetical protein [Rhodococcus opacus]
MYTSRIDRHPKGVTVNHHNVVNCMMQVASSLTAPGLARVLASTSVSFDGVWCWRFSLPCAPAGVSTCRVTFLVLGEHRSWSGGVISTVPVGVRGGTRSDREQR